MARRQPLRAFKVYRKGYLLEVKIYKVPVSKKNPLGYRFRCFMVHATTGEELSVMTITGQRAPTATCRGGRNLIRSKT